MGLKKQVAYIVNVRLVQSGGQSDITRHFASEEAARRYISNLPQEMQLMRFFKRTYIIEDEELG